MTKATQFGAATLLALIASPARGQSDRLPIIDMHLHALSISEWGVELPVAICAPVEQYPARDAAQPYGDFFVQRYLKGPPCAEPVWSPLSDEALMRGTIEVLERRRVFTIRPVSEVQSGTSSNPLQNG